MRIRLAPLYIKFGLRIDFVRAMDKNGSNHNMCKINFPVKGKYIKEKSSFLVPRFISLFWMKILSD